MTERATERTRAGEMETPEQARGGTRRDWRGKGGKSGGVNNNGKHTPQPHEAATHSFLPTPLCGMWYGRRAVTGSPVFAFVCKCDRPGGVSESGSGTHEKKGITAAPRYRHQAITA